MVAFADQVAAIPVLAVDVFRDARGQRCGVDGRHVAPAFRRDVDDILKGIFDAMGDLDEELPSHPIQFVGDLGDRQRRSVLDAFLEGEVDDQLLVPRLENSSLGEGNAEVFGADQVDDVRRARNSFESEKSIGVASCVRQPR